MSEVDNRVVSMQFDNAVFERRLSDTLRSLDNLSRSLELAGAKQGLTDVSAAVNGFDTSHMAASVENISSKFSALGAVGFTVIQSLTRAVLGFAVDIKNKFTEDVLSPIISGGTQRATNIEQAKFQFRGLGIDVDAAMKSALDAVRGTAFGLDEAAKIAAQFGASGMKAGADMTGALRGIAGAAAMTGTSFSEIGDIFAQSAASGKVNTMDLQQFASRGLNAAAAVAKQMHLTEAQVRDMASNGKLDFATFAKAMDGAFGKHATEANQTFTGALANMHAAMSRLGASFEGPKMEQQRDLFNTLGPAIDGVAKALKPLIDAFLFLRGMSNASLINLVKGFDPTKFAGTIKILSQVMGDFFVLFNTVVNAIKVGFGQVFPPATAKTFENIASALDRLIKALTPSKTTVAEISKIFAGLFSILDIGWAVIKGVIGVVAQLLGHFAGAGGGVLAFGANLGDTLTKFDILLVKGGAINRFFETLGDKVKGVIAFLVEIKDKVVAFFTSFDGIEGPALASVNRVSSRFEHLSGLFDRLKMVFEGIKGILGKLWEYLSTWFSELGHKLAAVMGPGDFNGIVDLINIGLLGGIIALFKKFLDGGFSLDALTGGLFEKVKFALDGVTGTLKAMQTELKAKALMEIAIALGVLTAAIVVLSLIDSAALTKALTALTVGFGELIGSMAAIDKLTGSVGGAAKLPIIAAGMNLLASAALILSTAIKNLSGLSWAEISKGLTAISGALAILLGAVKFMPPKEILATGLAMIPLATGLNILALAVKSFAEMSWGEMAKGMAGVGIGLGLITAAMNFMPATAVLAAGAAMIPLATGLRILELAVAAFGGLGWAEMGKGLLGIAGALGVIAVAMNLMPLTLPITAAGLVLVGVALGIIAEAVKLMGSMDFGTLAKGIGGVAAVMLILATATTAMDGALPGAAALIVVAGALHILSKVLIDLSGLSLKELAIGLGAIAAVLAVLAGAALLLTPIIPEMIGLGIALTLIGAGFALFGVGAILVAKAFQALATAGKAGVAALIESLKMILGALPIFVGAFLEALIKMADDILAAADVLIKTLTVLLSHILDSIIELSPKIADAMAALLTSGLLLIREKIPDIVETGYVILLALLRGINDHITEIVDKGVEIVVKFAQALTDNQQKLVDAAVNLLQAFLKAFGDRAADIATAGLDMLVAFIKGIIDNLTKIVESVGQIVTKFLEALGTNTQRIIDSGANVLVKFLEGLVKDISKVAGKVTDIAIAFVNAVATESVRFANAAGDALVSFLNGMAEAIRTHNKEIREAGINIASAIIDGLTFGLGDMAHKAVDAAVGLAKKAKDGVFGFLGINSPSRVFIGIGASMAEGMKLGLDRDTTAEHAAVAHAERIVSAFHKTLVKVPEALSGMDEFNPVITPVLDLTRVQQGTRGLRDMMRAPGIRPEISFDQARLISSTAPTANRGDQEHEGHHKHCDVTFNQNNYSPKALSTHDIYKSTKSQIAQAKEELEIK